ncbi:MAG: 6-bladed beta-propeller [Bacteroidota bacterium]
MRCITYASLLFIVFASCGQESEDVAFMRGDCILIDNADPNIIQDVSDHFELTTIPLDKEWSASMEYLNDFAFLDSLLILVGNSRVILGVDLSGEFLWRIAANEDERLGLGNFGNLIIDYERQLFAVESRMENTFFWFDMSGEFVKKEPQPLYANSRAYLGENKSVYDIYNMQQEGSPHPESSYDLVFLDHETSELSFWNRGADIFRRKIYASAGPNFVEGKDEIFYLKSFNDTVYSIQDKYAKYEFCFRFSTGDRSWIYKADPSIETSILSYFIDNDISYARYFLPIGEKYFGGYRSSKGYIGYIADMVGNELVNSKFWKIDEYVISAPWSVRGGYFIGLDYNYEVEFLQQKAEEGKLTMDIYQSGEMESLQDRYGDYQPATIFLLKVK